MEELMVLLGDDEEDQVLVNCETPQPLCHKYTKPIKEECVSALIETSIYNKINK